MRDENQPALNIGCGPYMYPNAINIDKYDSAEEEFKSPEAIDAVKEILEPVRPDVLADACNLPYPENYAGMIETHQMFEHLSKNECDVALNEWFRILRPGGFLVISTCDMEKILTGFPYEMTKINVYAWRAVFWMIYGSQQHPGQFHKSGHTPDLLDADLKKHGFLVKEIIPMFPPRPTPTFTILGQKPC
jgi:SAM-dependent methyltransferase